MTNYDPDRAVHVPATISNFWVFPGETEQCPLARQLVRVALRDRTSIVDDAELVISELFGNGCRHTRSGEPGGTLGVSVSALAAGPALVSVTDEGPTRGDRASGRRYWPTVKPMTPDTLGWRGLHLVATIADDWGHTPTDGLGLTVWAAFTYTLPLQQP